MGRGDGDGKCCGGGASRGDGEGHGDGERVFEGLTRGANCTLDPGPTAVTPLFSMVVRQVI